MPISRKILCAVYGLIGVLALIGTWGNNLQYKLGFLDANIRFWQDTLANPASRSITVDLLVLTLAVTIWLLLEARRLSMRGAWLYIFFGALVAISVTVPVFLINRERALAARDGASPAGTLSMLDVLGLVVLIAVSVAYTTLALMHA